MNISEFEIIKKQVLVRYNENNFYTELKENEILRERMMTMQQAEQYNGKYFSSDYIKRHILKQSNAEIQRIALQNIEEVSQTQQAQQKNMYEEDDK